MFQRALYVVVLSIFLPAVLSLTGCGGDGKIPVSGTVSWNGTPVEKGHIVFTPVDPAVTPEGSSIADGKFAFRATAGEKKVEIFADRPVGEPDPVMKLQRYAPYIPTRFNEKTELSVNVEAGGDNVFPFDLEGKKGDKIPGGDVATSLP
jgi:hypothetical protein